MHELNTGSALQSGEVVDLFCGIGGISHGFKRAGFEIRAGYDLDASCRHGFEANNAAPFFTRDVGSLTAEEIRSRFSGTRPTVLVGCAPCQPYSSYRQGKTDDRWSLLARFAKLACEVATDYVTMENVPGLVSYRDKTVFNSFLATLSETYPHVSHEIVDCAEFGVPQRRHRLVVIAGKDHEIRLDRSGQPAPVSVADTIRTLPGIPAGGVDAHDPLHRASNLTPLNLRRIRHSKPGETWHDWPDDLIAACHRTGKGAGYRSVYGRMAWNRPAPTMTTQCYGYGNGRFGHPEQDRAISLREAALLQSFPMEYSFFPDGRFPGFSTVGRWIGNAVPVKLAETIGAQIAQALCGERILACLTITSISRFP